MARRIKSHVAALAQPDLFAFADLRSAGTASPVVTQAHANDVALSKTVKSVPLPSEPVSVKVFRRDTTPSRIVAVTDMPDYPAVDQDLVDRSIAALPPNRMWFTYSAIRESFGVSRATVARKVKAGLVPGIRFHGASVIEDGPVRRFDRGQLRWLLLAVRSRH